MISEIELDAVLDYCRACLDAAEDLERAGGAHDGAVLAALRAWRGPHGRTFADRATDEATDRGAVIAGLRAEADAWARIWADTVNEINAERRQASIDDLGAEVVRPLDAVKPPRADNRYAPTGRLESW